MALVRAKIGAIAAAFKVAITVGRLPKTRSSKILRGTMRRSPTSRTGMPATIDDPAVLEEIEAAIRPIAASASEEKIPRGVTGARRP